MDGLGLLERFDCPVPWCAGYRPEHGGEGEEPGAWLHTGEDEQLGAGATAVRVARGAGPSRYAVMLDLSTERDAAGLRGLGAQLRQVAAALEARAGVLDARP